MLAKDLIQLLWPIALQWLVHQPVRSLEMADPGKTILFPGGVPVGAIPLPAQPFTPVEADLHLEGKPALQPQVHEPKLRMQRLEIEVLTLAGFQLQFQLLGLAIAAQEISPAGFHASQNSDQPLLEMIFFDELPRQGFLARMAGAQITKRTTGHFGQAQGGSLNALGQTLRKFLEVLEKNF